MEATTSLLCSSSKVAPFNSTLFRKTGVGYPSVRQFNKHPACKFSPSCYTASKPLKNHSLVPTNKPRCGFLDLGFSKGVDRLPHLQCGSFTNATAESEGFLKKVSFESLKLALLNLNPYDACKWALVCSVVVAASKWSLNVVFNPFLWMYFSWTWVFWPWIVAVALAGYGFYCGRKHLQGNANAFEQLAIVTSAFTWLTLVPPAHFNGFLEGWPVVFLFVYHYFFFFNVTVRKRLYGDYKPRKHDSKWDITLPNWQKVLFCAGVMVGHWLAAFEGPELHLVPGGWSNVGIWSLIMVTLFMQYHSTLYLANYSENVVEPTAVVQFGPYRFVRHPIYASTMLLFVSYFVALRAPLSALFITAVCSVYYGQKAKLEELVMVKTFGEMYTDYASKVRYKLIPFVY